MTAKGWIIRSQAGWPGVPGATFRPEFEYLPNGGWGWEPMSFMFTTWETARIEPWLADNASNVQIENMEGWHTLVLQVKDGKARYFVNGKLAAEYGGPHFDAGTSQPEGACTARSIP